MHRYRDDRGEIRAMLGNIIWRSDMPTKTKATPKKNTNRRRPTARKTGRASARPAKSARAQGLRLTEASPSFTVNDLDKSLAFYSNVMGFVVKDRWERDG